jgi:hypothetical protein
MIARAGLDLVFFTSSPLGIEAAAALVGLPEVRSVHLITTSLPRPRSPVERLLKTWRYYGPAGLLASVRSRLPMAPAAPSLADLAARVIPAAVHFHYADLHSADCLDHIRRLRPDLGIVFACYRLQRNLFEIPRLGTLNLHLGKAPDFRGSSPGFYELLAGVPEIGVTVHWVDDDLDTGPIVRQRTFPLDTAPPGDPIRYLSALQRTVLVPAGAALLADAVRGEAYGESVLLPQPAGGGRPHRRATWAQQRMLRRIVAARRAG